jgi:hypothetical protein
MKIETYNNYSEEKKGLVNVCKLIRSRFEQMDLFFVVIYDLFPEILDEYLDRFTIRLRSEIKNRNLEYGEVLDILDFSRYRIISSSKKLTKTMLEYIAQKLNISELWDIEMRVKYYDQMASRIGLHYNRTKSFTDILGTEEGISHYKTVIIEFVRRHYSIDSYPDESTLDNHRKNMINSLSNQGLANFTVGIIDDFRNIYRIDKCMEHEILKQYNDPDVAYYSQCYIADIPQFNENRVIHVKRNQTLNHADFCDEMYWNNNQVKDAQQPDLELVKSMTMDDGKQNMG